MIRKLAARRHILRAVCTKFNFCWGFAQTPRGDFSPLAGFRGKDVENHSDAWEKIFVGRKFLNFAFKMVHSGVLYSFE